MPAQRVTYGSATQRSPLTIAAMFMLVLGVIVVAQVAALSYLGYVAGGSTTTQNCQINIWVIHTLCTTSVSASPSAQNAEQLANLLGPVFAVMDVLIAALAALVAIRDRGVSSRAGSGGSARELRGR